ncbi:BZ3500_MvSof-1268-A1-R1_Chr11-1g03212 [Microbotryum saponariae]|uniref:Nucleolar protein 9 n=1 Tax=Microbotryum saponariae TaxID=289078 RepID=A0A2X0N8U0_9BASI|nr:BZ3501_MvSof-1269-A2-R1_Chr11g02787 [Microbotryum saponariae]SDA03772.1 BZ3500_MvSof-1268-A1-R1_Chr11-1g03212 [Microbotryum saponariae]
MPRPRQRRGADAKKEAKQVSQDLQPSVPELYPSSPAMPREAFAARSQILKREQQEQAARAQELAEKRARHKKSEMPWTALPHRAVASTSNPANGHSQGEDGPSGSGPAGPVDPNALPECDPDTKAYFQQVDQQIAEMESLGVGRQHRAAEGEEDEEDDRPLLLRSALESLSGNELALAGDTETSVILERLLYSMDDFAKRVLADRFTGNYDRLVRHQRASHVLQTLFVLAGETVDRETRGIIALPPTASTSSSSLPTMSTLIISIITELVPELPSLLYDSFGSHCLRALLLLVAGQAPTAEGQSGGAERSKRSLQFRKAQGSMKSFLGPTEGAADSSTDKGKKTRSVPKEFDDALKTMWTTLEVIETNSGVLSSSSAGIPGDGVRKAAMDAVAGPAVRILIELEAARPKGWRIGGWADRVLCGLIEEVKKPDTTTEARTNLREEYLGGLLRHPASAPTLETILQQAPDRIVKALWTDFFAGKLHRLAGNAVANFVVAVALSRLDKDLFVSAVEELSRIARERRAEWVDNSRTGVMKMLLERASALESAEKEVSDLILDTFGLHTPEERLLMIPCVLSLNRLEYYRKLPSHVTVEPTVQGSLLLQAFAQLHAPHSQALYDSLSSFKIEALTPLTRNPTSSRLIDAFLDSPTTPPREIRGFLLSLIGHYHTLADDRIGSRLVEHCWAVADVFLKDKIAQSISQEGQLPFLQQSPWAHFWAKKLELPLWERRREDWKTKMRQRDVELKGLKTASDAAAAAATSAASADDSKRKKRKKDEVDEIFETRFKGKKSKAMTNGEGGEAGGEALVDVAAIEEASKRSEKVKKERAKERTKGAHDDGLDEVLEALKNVK